MKKTPAFIFLGIFWLCLFCWPVLCIFADSAPAEASTPQGLEKSAASSLTQLLYLLADQNVHEVTLRSPITLKGDLTFPKPVTQAEGVVITTDGHTLTIEKDSLHGPFRRFDARAGEVVFKHGADQYGYFEWWYDGRGDYAPAMTSALYSGLPIKGISSKNYTTASTVGISGLNIDISPTGEAPFTITPGGAFRAFFFAGTKKCLATTVSLPLPADGDSVILDEAEGLAAGDLIRLVSDKLWYYDNRGIAAKGEWHQVARVDGNTIFFNDRVYDFYSTEEKISVDAYSPIHCRLSGFRIIYPADSDTGGLDVAYASGAELDGIGVNGAKNYGIGIGGSIDVTIDRPEVTGANDTVLGYGISIGESYNVYVQRGEFFNCKRGVDFTGSRVPSRNGTVLHCTASAEGPDPRGTPLWSNASGFGTHGPAENIYFLGNIVRDAQCGIYTRGANIVISGNFFEGRMSYPINIYFGTNVKVDHNAYNGNLAELVLPSSDQERPSILPAGFVYISPLVSPDGFFQITDNKARDITLSFAAIHSDLNDLTLKNNNVQFAAGRSAFVYMLSGDKQRKVRHLAYNGNTAQTDNSISKFIDFYRIALDMKALKSELFDVARVESVHEPEPERSRSRFPALQFLHRLTFSPGEDF